MPETLNESSIEEEYVIGRVVRIVEESATADQPYQRILVRFQTGERRGEEIEIEHGLVIGIYDHQRVREGERVVIVRNITAEDSEYFIVDKYRLPALGWLLAVLLATVIWLGRWKGVSSILGLAISIGVLAYWVIPSIATGSNPLLTSIGGALVIALVSIYLAHGFNRRTTIAVISTLTTLVITMVVAWLGVRAARLSGVGSDEAFYLQLGVTQINLEGLLLGGIIIGALGVLDDITTSQAAAVAELKLANPSLDPAELYRRGIVIGTEHIASLVNTLALAYVGTSFPLLLLFSNTLRQPAWIVVNSERVAEEIVRTVVGSLALVLAVPIVTWLAAREFGQKPPRHQELGHHHGHVH